MARQKAASPPFDIKVSYVLQYRSSGLCQYVDDVDRGDDGAFQNLESALRELDSTIHDRIIRREIIVWQGKEYRYEETLFSC